LRTQILGRRFGSASDVELFEDVTQMNPDRAGGNIRLVGNFFVGEPPADQLQDFNLAVSQTRFAPRIESKIPLEQSPQEAAGDFGWTL